MAIGTAPRGGFERARSRAQSDLVPWSRHSFPAEEEAGVTTDASFELSEAVSAAAAGGGHAHDPFNEPCHGLCPPDDLAAPPPPAYRVAVPVAAVALHRGEAEGAEKRACMVNGAGAAEAAVTDDTKCPSPWTLRV